MKFIVALSFLGAASAFAPSNMQSRSGTVLNMAGDDKKDMSTALPFVPRPKLLDGSLPGDVGFE